MTVKDILEKTKRPVITITGDKTIRDAMKVLIENKIGSVVVIGDAGDPVGILTERDVFRLCYESTGGIMDMKISDHMTVNLLIGVPDDDIEYIASVITSKRVRHIPIIDKKKKLCGLISIGDIVKARMKQAEVHVRYLQEYITGRGRTADE
jgi:CBS domain-containing protein